MSLRDHEFVESLEGFYATSTLNDSKRLPVSSSVRFSQPPLDLDEGKRMRVAIMQ